MKKVVLVTGGGSGVGRSSALALNNAGYAVILTGRRQETLEETMSIANEKKDKFSGGMSSIVADVSDPASVDNLFSDIKNQFGRLDVLFNNAGVNVPSTTFGDLTYLECEWPHPGRAWLIPSSLHPVLDGGGLLVRYPVPQCLVQRPMLLH